MGEAVPRKGTLKRFVLTKDDLLRRYREDMEEARKEHFVGPIARAMYTFERVMVIVSTILTLCTLCMILYNYILADVLELRSATREDWSAPGLDRVEADAETGGIGRGVLTTQICKCLITEKCLT